MENIVTITNDFEKMKTIHEHRELELSPRFFFSRSDGPSLILYAKRKLKKVRPIIYKNNKQIKV